MNKTDFMAKVHKTLCRSKLALKAHSPEILVVSGTIGVVVSAVLACRATLKAKEVVDTTRNMLDDIHEAAENAVIENNGEIIEEYTDKDRKKDITSTYLKMGASFAKLYAPSVILGTFSLVSILTSHRILQRRAALISAAYTAVDGSFRQYRSRVIDRFGEDVDKELKNGIKAQTFVEKIKGADGKETESQTTVPVLDPHEQCDEYTRFFDNSSHNWTQSPEYNMTYLRAQEAYFNQKLIANGYVFLNDVLNTLDLKVSSVGQIVGWIYDPENPKHRGDNFIDFGIYNVNIPETADFVNGYTPSVLLNFNVDGPIINTAFKENKNE